MPTDTFDQAKMDQWLFWEQYSHEAAIAVARFRVLYLGQAVEDLDPALVTKGNAALEIMENHLAENTWFVGNNVTLADVALYAYTQFADEGGFTLDECEKVREWLVRVKYKLSTLC